MNQSNRDYNSSINIKAILKKYWIWLIPALLFISSSGWQSSFYDDLTEQSPSSLLRICQTVGVLSSLLLGVWWLAIFRRDNIFGRASFGMLGIGLAISILLTIFKYPLPLICSGLILQFLWLVVTVIYTRKDSTIKTRRLFLSRLKQARADVFGKFYIHLRHIISQICGLLFCTMMTCFGWTIVSVLLVGSSQSNLSILTGFGLVCGISFVLFFALTPAIVILKNVDVRLLSKPPESVSEVRKIVLSEFLPGSLFLVFSFFVLILISKNLLLITIIIYLPFVVFCLYLYRKIIRAFIQFKNPDAIERLRCVYRDNAEEINKGIGIRIISKVEVAREGIKTTGIMGEILYQWETIKHIYVTQGLSIFIVDIMNEKAIGRFLISGKRNSAKIEEMMRLWGENTAQKITVNEHEYPRIFQVRDERNNKLLPWGSLGLAIFMATIGTYFFMTWEEESNIGMTIVMGGFYAFLIVLGIVFAIGGIHTLTKPPKVLSSVQIDQGKIRIRYTDGIYVDYASKDLVKCRYKGNEGCYELCFTDGKTINSVDKLSYFGILKLELDSMMTQRNT